MYVKKLKLNVDDMSRLLLNGECLVEKELVIDSIYEVSGVGGLFVKACKYEGDKVKVCKYEGEVKSTPRGKKEGLRKANVISRRDEGMFVGGKSKFEVGDEVAVMEAYAFICDRLSRAYMKEIAKVHGIEDVNEVKALGGWYNKKLVLAEAMPRRLEVVSAEVKRVREISEEEWHLLGVDWVNKEMEIDRKRSYVGRVAWDNNQEVVLYRYKTLKGSVQTEADLKSYKEKCPWIFEKGK